MSAADAVEVSLPVSPSDEVIKAAPVSMPSEPIRLAMSGFPVGNGQSEALIIFQLPEAVQQLGLEGAEESVLELIEQKKIIVAYNGETKRCWLEMTEEIKW